MEENQKIELKLSDWLFNAGLLGFINVLGEEALENESLEIDNESRLIKFSPDVLEDFEYKYFDFFIKRYGKTLTYGKILEFEEYIDKFEAGKIEIISVDDLKKINDKIAFFKDKLKSNSYKSTYGFIEKDGEKKIEKLEKNLKKIKELKEKDSINEKIVQEIKANFSIMKEIIEFFKKRILNERGYGKNYLAAKNVAYVIINNAWSGVSFLNRGNAAKDIYEEYKSYFVDPAREYVKNYESNKSKYKFRCIVSDMPMKDYKNTLGFLNNTGFDVNRKPSHVWNFVNDIAVNPLITLIYSCIPAGFIYGPGKGIFVNANHNIGQLRSVNNGIADEIYNENFNERNISLYKNLLNEIEKEKSDSLKYELSDVQIVKYEDEKYRFTLLSKNILQLLFNNKKRLDNLIEKWFSIDRRYFYLYDITIAELLNNENLFSLINRLCYYKISGIKSNYKLSNLEDMLKINLGYIRRLKEMEKVSKEERSKQISYELEEKDIYSIRKDGMEFRKIYLGKSGNDKKMGSLLYKLQNALRINNVSMFMDTLISGHAYADRKVHYLFGKALLDDENFQTLGHAFLIGLLGEEKADKGIDGDKNKNNDKNEENNKEEGNE